ncbi:hypothetical protein LguiB_024380 [Lonicera macranthoides]
METTTPYLDGRVKPQIRHHPPTEDNNNNNLFIDFLDEYSLFRRVLTLRELPVLSVLPIPGFPLLRSSSSGEEADDKKKKLNIKVERLLKVVDYQYLRSENDYYKAILDYDNVICICLGGKYDPFDHFVAPDDDTYHFVDLVAKKHKETRFLIADSVYCPELVRLLNPDTVFMSIQVIKERKSLGFLGHLSCSLFCVKLIMLRFSMAESWKFFRWVTKISFILNFTGSEIKLPTVVVKGVNTVKRAIINKLKDSVTKKDNYELLVEG